MNRRDTYNAIREATMCALAKPDIAKPERTYVKRKHRGKPITMSGVFNAWLSNPAVVREMSDVPSSQT